MGLLRSTISFFVFASAVVSTATATTHWVPDDFAEIQGAINAAVNGDEVVVRAGTYIENITYLGKSIAIRSESGPAVTTINGGQPSDQDQAAVVFMDGNATSLIGFSITGGSGSKVFGPTGPLAGGGIIMVGQGLINGNWVFENHVRDSDSYAGGGIYIHTQGTVQVSDNRVFSNSISQTGGGFDGFGGGIGVRKARGVIFNNVVWGNSAGLGGDAGRGGGIGTESLTTALLRSNVISCNHASLGGGVFGIFGEISQNTIVQNDTHGVVGSSTDFFNNDISANTGVGIACESGGVGSCNNFFGNTEEDLDCFGAGTNDNTNYDPQYDGLACEDLCLLPSSPLLPENEELGCGLIGAIGACETSGTEAGSTPWTKLASPIRVSPNPVQGHTILTYRVEQPGIIHVGVYDLQGRSLRDLHSDYRSAGQLSLTWDGRDDAGDILPSGSYLVMLHSGEIKESRRILVIR